MRQDWRKLIDHPAPRSKSKKAILTTLIDPTLTPTQPARQANDDRHGVTTSSEVSLTRPSSPSRASTWSRTSTQSASEGLDSMRDVWPPGEFDGDEVPNSLQVARSSKETKAAIASTGVFANQRIFDWPSLRETKLAARANSHYRRDLTESRPTASYTNRTTATVRCVILARLPNNSVCRWAQW